MHPPIILQYENRSPRPFEGFLANINAYAHAHGYSHFVVDGSDSTSYPPYYAKVFEMMRLCQVPEYDGALVLYLDVDCVVVQDHIRLEDIAEQFLQGDRVILYAGSVERFNAGHLLIRNTREARRVLSTWMECYDPRAWTFDGSWSCHDPKNPSLECKWSQRYYEQGDFKIFIMRDPNLTRYLVFDPNHFIFKSCDTFGEGTPLCFILHLCSRSKFKPKAVDDMIAYGMPRDKALAIVESNMK